MVNLDNEDKRSKQKNNIFLTDPSSCDQENDSEGYDEDDDEEEYCLVNKPKERKKITKFKIWKEQER